MGEEGETGVERDVKSGTCEHLTPYSVGILQYKHPTCSLLTSYQSPALHACKMNLVLRCHMHITAAVVGKYSILVYMY